MGVDEIGQPPASGARIEVATETISTYRSPTTGKVWERPRPQASANREVNELIRFELDKAISSTRAAGGQGAGFGERVAEEFYHRLAAGAPYTAIEQLLTKNLPAAKIAHPDKAASV